MQNKKHEQSFHTKQESNNEKTNDGSEFEKIRFVLMTEKAVQIIENQNKITFIVDRKAGKQDIKDAVESAFQSKVKNVKTLIDQEGRKKAFVRFDQAGAAGEIAIKLGII